MATSSIDGLISGLSTTDIINKLMEAERAPMLRIQKRGAQQDTIVSAWQSVNTALGTFRSANAALLSSSALEKRTVTSSDTSIVTATAGPGSSIGAVSLRVLALAKAQQSMTSTNIGTADTLTGTGSVAIGVGLSSLGVSAVAASNGATAGARAISIAATSGGQMEITVGDSSVVVAANATSASVGGLDLSFTSGPVAGSASAVVATTNATTTFGQLAAALSTSGSPVVGQIVNVSSTTTADNRLVLSARDTGATNTIMVGTTGLTPAAVTSLGTLTTLTAASDAQVTLGTGAGAITVTRPSNTINDLLQDVSLSLKKADPPAEVVLGVDRDNAAIIQLMRQWVTATNRLLGTIDNQTRYDAATKQAGVLVGDSGARSLRSTLSQMLATKVGTGDYSTLSSVGVSVQRDGSIAFDESKFTAALSADPTSVKALLSRSGSESGATLGYQGVSDTTKAGTYAVNVTTAATKAAITGEVITALASDELLTIKLGDRETTYNALNGATAEQVADGLNAALKSAGIAATATVSGGAITLAANAYGSAQTLQVKSSLAGAGTTGLGGAIVDTFTSSTGVDVAGTINGQAATGAGQILTSTTGDADGLKVKVTGTTTGALGTVTYSAGIMGLLAAELGSKGSATVLTQTSINGAKAAKLLITSQLDAYNQRLTLTEQRLKNQFSTLERVLNQTKAQGDRLASFISGNSNG